MELSPIYQRYVNDLVKEVAIEQTTNHPVFSEGDRFNKTKRQFAAGGRGVLLDGVSDVRSRRLRTTNAARTFADASLLCRR